MSWNSTLCPLLPINYQATLGTRYDAPTTLAEAQDARFGEFCSPDREAGAIVLPEPD